MEPITLEGTVEVRSYLGPGDERSQEDGGQGSDGPAGARRVHGSISFGGGRAPALPSRRLQIANCNLQFAN